MARHRNLGVIIMARTTFVACSVERMFGKRYLSVAVTGWSPTGCESRKKAAKERAGWRTGTNHRTVRKKSYTKTV
eukprot:4057269-Amphidinium_carterae.1